ncbi:F-BAR and double SH3 domains protein 1-like [Anabrus simplex]|uniref:F-BAR and double SH3 domains protein 1-like n=1 Tax=Anabrus simplex TaxID=316456 RepID=UPI0035A33C4E
MKKSLCVAGKSCYREWNEDQYYKYTMSDFTQQLSQVYEQHAEELQLLVASFRKRNAELRKERPACPSALFHTWETLLQEVEVDSQAHSDIASVLGRQVSRPLLERSFHRKIQSRKVFTHRESYETILTKTEDKLVKCRQDYKTTYLAYLGGPSTSTLAAYLDAHNDYVTQLHATNGMLERYHQEALPQLLQRSNTTVNLLKFANLYTYMNMDPRVSYPGWSQAPLVFDDGVSGLLHSNEVWPSL